MNTAEVDLDRLVDYEREYRSVVKRAQVTGDHMIGLCPFHDDSKNSFSVDLKTGRWHCFSEDIGGNYVDFVAKMNGISTKDAYKQHRTDKEIELREQKMQADIALKESQGELHRLKTEIAAGQYISVEEVKLDYAKFFVVFKKFAMSIPARVTGMLSGQMEPSELRRCEKEIAAEVNRLLGAFVIAGIVGPEDVKKDGTLKEEKNTDS